MVIFYASPGEIYERASLFCNKWQDAGNSWVILFLLTWSWVYQLLQLLLQAQSNQQDDKTNALLEQTLRVLLAITQPARFNVLATPKGAQNPVIIIDEYDQCAPIVSLCIVV